MQWQYCISILESKLSMAENKRLRGNNFQYEENLRLLELITKHKAFLQNKRSDAVTWRQKDDTWIQLCEEFNSGCKTPRTVEQLKAKYDNLKKRTRAKVANEKKNIFKTGGGSHKPSLNDCLTDQVLSLITISAQGTVNPWDSNAEKDCELGLIGESDKAEVIFTFPEPITEEVIGTSTEELAADTSKDWHGSGYCPAMLRQPLNPILKLGSPGATEWEGELPGTSDSRSEASCRPKSPSLKKDPKPWTARRRPQHTSPVTIASNNSCKYGKLATAKTELAQLQISIVQQEYEERKQRDTEEHLRRIKVLDLDIQIREEQLRKLKHE